MSTLLEQLDRLLVSERPVCFTALVETRGSTPQKPGATMLIQHDGVQFGTLGGGCVEAEVKQRALTRLYDRLSSSNDNATSPDIDADAKIPAAELLEFTLDGVSAWDDGLICGGRMKMLVVPVFPGDDRSYFQTLRDHLATGRGCMQVVVLDSVGAAGGSNGDLFLLDATDNVVAVRKAANSHSLPGQLATHLKPLDSRPRPYVVSGMSFLPHLERCRLIVIGAGHVGQKVAQLAADVDFEVWVVDDRADYCCTARFPLASRLIVQPFDDAFRNVAIDHDTYCIIVTRGHSHDEQALKSVVQTSARYIGMIGSHRKIKLIFDDLLREGISKDALRQVYAPLGFDIGSQTVGEIAISITAELIAHRNLGSLPKATRGPTLVDELP